MERKPVSEADYMPGNLGVKNGGAATALALFVAGLIAL